AQFRSRAARGPFESGIGLHRRPGKLNGGRVSTLRSPKIRKIMTRFLPCLLYLAVIRSVRLRCRTPHRESSMEWSSERIEQLRSLWHDGLSASQIATHLGGITRNAVIGKAHRLGL